MKTKIKSMWFDWSMLIMNSIVQKYLCNNCEIKKKSVSHWVIWFSMNLSKYGNFRKKKFPKSFWHFFNTKILCIVTLEFLSKMTRICKTTTTKTNTERHYQDVLTLKCKWVSFQGQDLHTSFELGSRRICRILTPATKLR